MKKWWIISLALALWVLPAQAEYIMTEEEMTAIWQESFERMHTTGEMSLRTLEDLPAFEAEYTAATGLERKEDLVFESLPMQGDMPYDEALGYARKLIIDKFGTPEEELDAMGVYPRLIDHIYTDRESEWEFYFTPRRDTDIHLDHDYESPGEYRVVFGARTGTVDYVNWYIDAFFPDYARRTWEAGRFEYVYSQAMGQDFYRQSPEDHAEWMRLFEEAGYSTAELERTDEELLTSIRTELMFANPQDNLLSSGLPEVEAALAALEKEYGLTREDLAACGYAAVLSPLQQGTVDICFAYNYNLESAMYETGELTAFSGKLFSYASRLGLYMAKVNPDGQVEKLVYLPRGREVAAAEDKSLLLGRREWTAADLPAFREGMAQLRALEAQAATQETPDYMALEAEADAIMRSLGGDPSLYSARREQPTDIGLEKAKEIAWQAMQEISGLTPGQAQAAYGCDGQYDVQGFYAVWFFGLTAERTDGYFATIDAETGEVLHCSYTESGGNG